MVQEYCWMFDIYSCCIDYIWFTPKIHQYFDDVILWVQLGNKFAWSQSCLISITYCYYYKSGNIEQHIGWIFKCGVSICAPPTNKGRDERLQLLGILTYFIVKNVPNDPRKEKSKPFEDFVENNYRSIYIKKWDQFVHCRVKISQLIIKGAFVIIKLERTIAMK